MWQRGTGLSFKVICMACKLFILFIALGEKKLSLFEVGIIHIFQQKHNHAIHSQGSGFGACEAFT